MSSFVISHWLKKHGLTASDFVINRPSHSSLSFSVTINKSFNLSNKKIYEIPFKILKVNGDFNCSHNNFSNFKNFPDEVSGNFNCSHNNFHSFVDSPNVLGDIIATHNLFSNLHGIKANKSINVSNNILTNFNGCPNQINGNLNFSFNSINRFNSDLINIDGDLNISNNMLTNFINSPNVAGSIIANNNQINNFKGINCKRSINVSHNQLMSFINCPEIIDGYFNCSHNQLSDFLSSPHTIKGDFNYSNNLFSELTNFPSHVSGGIISNNNSFLVSNSYISDHYKKQDVNDFYKNLNYNKISKIINDNELNTVTSNGLTVSMNIFKNLHLYSGITESEITKLIKKTDFQIKDFQGNTIIYYIVNYQNGFFKNENLPKKRK